MENPYPRRNELPSSERQRIAEIDQDRHDTIRDLNQISKSAELVVDTTQLYDESSYLGDYVHEVTPLSDSPNNIVHTAFVRRAIRATHNLVAYQEERDATVAALPKLTASLFTPVRDFDDARIVKQGNLPNMPWYNPDLPEVGDYRDVTIEQLDEPLVSLVDYDIACRSYYSRPNGVTGGAVEGVKPDIFVLKSTAEKLVALNELVRQPEVTAFFGGEVELFVDEGYRDPELQRYLHDNYIPKLITKQLAEQQGINLETASDEVLTKLEEEMIPMRNKKIARPSKKGETTPGPHQTAAAVDLTIRYKQDTKDLVPKVNIWYGKDPASLTKVTDPDHFEHTLPTTHEELVAQQNLRAWHALLESVGLRQNPTEFWHVGHGDQLSAITDGDIETTIAKYGWPAEGPITFIPPTEIDSSEKKDA